MNITEFLESRIGEDEALAVEASPGPWRADEECSEVLAVDGVTVAEGFALSGAQLRATTRHIAHHDPARVLAECAAKREVLKWVTDFTVLEALAAVYHDHSDYDPNWALADS